MKQKLLSAYKFQGYVTGAFVGKHVFHWDLNLGGIFGDRKHLFPSPFLPFHRVRSAQSEFKPAVFSSGSNELQNLYKLCDNQKNDLVFQNAKGDFWYFLYVLMQKRRFLYSNFYCRISEVGAIQVIIIASQSWRSSLTSHNIYWITPFLGIANSFTHLIVWKCTFTHVSVGEVKYSAEVPHFYCTFAFRNYLTHTKHLPFSIVDHFIGLDFAGGSVFLMAPIFSRRPGEVLSLLDFRGFFRLFGRKQNGIAARKLITPPIKKPSHHAPTQRESCGVIAIFPIIKWNRTELIEKMKLPTLNLLK